MNSALIGGSRCPDQGVLCGESADVPSGASSSSSSSSGHDQTLHLLQGFESEKKQKENQPEAASSDVSEKLFRFKSDRKQLLHLTGESETDVFCRFHPTLGVKPVIIPTPEQLEVFF